MREIRVQDTTVRLYDSIQNLPASRDSLMNYYLLSDMGVGSDMQAVDHHLNSLLSLVYEPVTEEGLSKLQQRMTDAATNLRLSYHSILSQYNPRHLAWACLIESIDGQPLTDTGEAALKALVGTLSDKGLTVELLEESLNEIKKKFPPSWELTFPDGEESADLWDWSNDTI
jgi:hypothetical protein